MDYLPAESGPFSGMVRALVSSGPPPWQELTVRTRSIPSSTSLKARIAILRVYFCSSASPTLSQLS